MRLAAVYIKKHFLFDKPQTINFGGKNIYSFDPVDDKPDEIVITKTENPDFIDGFWGNNISLVSAIVGANGAGKTSMLQIVNQIRDYTNACFIYEDSENKVLYQNRIGLFDDNGAIIEKSKDKIIINDFEATEIETRVETQSLYYSNTFDQKVDDFHSLLKLNSNYPEDKLSTIFSNNFLLDIIFLNSETSDEIKIIYKDFPKYDSAIISANKLHKRNLENLYLGSNLGFTNVLEEFRKEINHLIQRLNDKKYNREIDQTQRKLSFNKFLIYVTDNDRLFDSYKIIIENLINDISVENKFLEIFKKNDFGIENFNKDEKQSIFKLIDNLKSSKSIPDFLKYFWDKYPNVNPKTSHLIHDKDNFIKNLEINILSLIVLNDTFPRTSLEGTFDTNRILEQVDFEKIMNTYLEKYLIHSNGTLTISILEEIKQINIIKDKDRIIDIIKESFKITSVSGAGDVTFVKRRMIEDVEGFANIMDFYNYVKKITPTNSPILDLDVKDDKTVNRLKVISEKYEKVKKYFSNSQIRDYDIIEVKPSINLSFGEKSILNLYSTFYNFTLPEGHERNFKNYLVLLDEGDLGYHPMWKKKYIDAITRTLPIVFNKLNPKFFNNENKYQNYEKENPTIQIIFTTHDPLTLSDIPNSNVVYLKKDGDKTSVLDNSQENKKSFGANITDLLTDSFFINDGLIGDFAKGKIEETIDWLNKQKELKLQTNEDYIVNEIDFNKHEKLINIVDEPVIQRKLAEMLDELKDGSEIEKEIAKNQIEFLKTRYNLE